MLIVGWCLVFDVRRLYVLRCVLFVVCSLLIVVCGLLCVWHVRVACVLFSFVRCLVLCGVWVLFVDCVLCVVF